MKVLLKRDVFINDSLFEAREYGIEMPDELKPYLPKDAKIVDITDYLPPQEDVLMSRQDHDSERAETDLSTAYKGKRANK